MCDSGSGHKTSQLCVTPGSTITFHRISEIETYARIQLGQPGHVIAEILLIFVVFIGSASVYAVFLLKIKLTLLSSCCQTRKNTPFLRLSIRLLINR